MTDERWWMLFDLMLKAVAVTFLYELTQAITVMSQCMLVNLATHG